MSTQSFDVTPSARTSPAFSIPPGKSVKASSSGTFTGYVRFEYSKNNGATWQTMQDAAVDTNLAGVTWKNETNQDQRFRFKLYDTDSLTVATGTCTTVVTDDMESVIDKPGEAKHVIVATAGKAKAGATSGWVVAAADDISIVTCPASKTGSTLVVPIHNLKVGSTIVGFHLQGRINSAGNAATIDAALHSQTPAAGSTVDASLGAITQISKTAQTVVNAANSRVGDINHVVLDTETFYVLVTVTTAGSTDIALSAVVLEVIEPKA